MARTGPQAVVRLRIRRREGRWSVVKQTRIEAMTITPSYQLPDARGRALTGAWCEATDEAGEVIYRTLLPHLAGTSVEVPREGGGLQRADEYREDDEFDIVVPDTDALHSVNVFVTDPRGGQARVTGAPVASLRLPRGGRR